MICLSCQGEIQKRENAALGSPYYEHINPPEETHTAVRAPETHARDRRLNPYCAECWGGEFHQPHCSFWAPA